MMKVEITSNETIIPSSPTPPHLKKIMLSLLDQLAPAMYLPSVLFYRPPHTGDDHVTKFTEMSQCLKKSLSETLSLFFPTAGRFKDNVSIDCNDEGVEYFEARVDCLLDDVLENPKNDVLKRLLVHVDNTCEEIVKRCQLLVQVNLFKCGGIAIGVSFSHKLFDATALTTFLKVWSTATLKKEGESVIVPDFTTTSSVLPSMKEIPMSENLFIKAEDKNIIKTFVFDDSKIAELKSKAASACVLTPTRVETVSALIWKCTMKAGMMVSDLEEFRKPYVFVSTMNMSKRLVPPLPENSMGNVIGIFAAQSEDIETDLGTLVGLLRKEMLETCNFITTLGDENGIADIFELLKNLENEVKTCRFLTYSSWCKLPLYELDFGWGKPLWVGVAVIPYANLVMLIDSKDGVGVEAYVSLSREEMAMFECDPEILAFASVKGNV